MLQTNTKDLEARLAPSQVEIVHVDRELEDLIPGFLQNRHKELITLNEMRARQDLAAIAAYGHTLKGTALNYGFQRLGEIAMAMEIAAKAGDLELAEKSIAEIQTHLDRIEIVYTD